ncbi:SdpI family protein [Clostridium perfringens]|uniref:SdpI family protein n=1 Tax=Clostridium perfringens TaxID=1502 RepID=A0AAP4A6P7_CLOPF|nr:SdpI family protein [Clostridium perfringens]MDH2336039.1 SdpI family protein [Clostridium perfringens]
MKKFDFINILFLITSFIILIGGFMVKESNLTISIIGAVVIFILIIFDVNAPKIAKLSEENVKIKTMKTLNRLTILIIIIGCMFSILSPIKSSLDSKTNEILLVGLCSIFIMFFGNLAPKIPFNRYMGLRLPWTVRDKDTWRVAHRILGYVSFPIGIMMFVLSFFFKIETIVVTGILTWIIIPSIYSLVFYYKKIKGISI